MGRIFTVNRRRMRWSGGGFAAEMCRAADVAHFRLYCFCADGALQSVADYSEIFGVKKENCHGQDCKSACPNRAETENRGGNDTQRAWRSRVERLQYVLSPDRAASRFSFAVQFPAKRLPNAATMTDAELDAEASRGFDDIAAWRKQPLSAVVSSPRFENEG